VQRPVEPCAAEADRRKAAAGFDYASLDRVVEIVDRFGRGITLRGRLRRIGDFGTL
jgi:hypothetical protein